jgi:hypothetical protein
MSDIGGAGASSKGADQEQYPYFQSPGGVTSQQQALADYDYGQNLTEGQAQFEGSDQGGGPSLSTMATQVAGGANMGKAINEASLSDADQSAAFKAYQNAENIDQQNNANTLASNEQETQQATSTATSLGKLAAAGA